MSKEKEIARLNALFKQQKAKQQELDNLEKNARRSVKAAEKAAAYEESEKTATTAWDKVVEHSDNLLSNRREGYESIISAMQNMFSFVMKIAAWERAKGPILLGKAADFIGNIGGSVYDKMASQSPDPLIPVIEFDLEFDDKKECVKTTCVRQDNTPLTIEQKTLLEAVAVGFFKEKGYNPILGEKNRGKYVHEDGTRLSAEKFGKILPDFQAYLNQWEPAAPASSPRP